MRRFQHSLAPVDSISTIDEQLVHSDHKVEDGELIWVRSERCVFVYRLNSGLVADGVTVVQAQFGPGVWVRLPGTGDGAWAAQPAWYIDPQNALASDQNTGADATHPLRTFAELRRRLNRATLTATVVIHVQSAPSVILDDPFDIDLTITKGHTLTVVGQTTVVHSGTFTGGTAVQNRATQASAVCEDSAFDFTASLGRIIQISSSLVPTKIGSWSAIQKVHGAGGHLADISRFVTFSPDMYTGVGAVVFDPSPGDGYQVLDFPHIAIGTISLHTESPGVDTDYVRFDTIMLDGGTATVVAGTGLLGRFVPVYLTRSRLRGILFNSDFLFCSGDEFESLSIFDSACVTTIAAGACVKQAADASSGFFQTDGSHVYAGFDFTMAANGGWAMGGVCYTNFGHVCMNGAGQGIKVDVGSVLSGTDYFGEGGDLLWGVTAAGFGVLVMSGGKALFTTKPTVNATLGSTREYKIAGVGKTWNADYPTVDTAHAAFVVPFA